MTKCQNGSCINHDKGNCGESLSGSVDALISDAVSFAVMIFFVKKRKKNAVSAMISAERIHISFIK